MDIAVCHHSKHTAAGFQKRHGCLQSSLCRFHKRGNQLLSQWSARLADTVDLFLFHKFGKHDHLSLKAVWFPTHAQWSRLPYIALTKSRAGQCTSSSVPASGETRTLSPCFVLFSLYATAMSVDSSILHLK